MPAVAEDRTVGGRIRARPLADMLTAARDVASKAGITRLADITALDRLGLPIFQASRPAAKCLSTALGKGLTRRAAMVSALLEGIEIDAAERATFDGQPRALDTLGEYDLRAWHSTPRADLAIRLDPHLTRGWVQGFDLMSGRHCPTPFDLVSLDFTLGHLPDTLRSTIGLASGGTSAEACASAVAELLEHDLEAAWAGLSMTARRRTRMDLASIDDPLVRAILKRIGSAGAHVHLWALGQDRGIAAFYCAITDPWGAVTSLPPTSGTGCHPARAVAALLAILEAAQARAAMISGARDDLLPTDYAEARSKTVAFVLEMMSFGPSSLRWSDLPTTEAAEPEKALDILLAAAAQVTSLPVVATTLRSPHPWITIVKVVAPGLCYLKRTRPDAAATPAVPVPASITTRSHRRLVFVGPTFPDAPLPANIERRPPAAAGDLAALLDDPPEAVGLIDGCFESGPSVWHKELLDLMACGTAVFGAASIGALRAADLHEAGMIGIGRIFEAYRDGRIIRDDAVMLVHAPAELGFRTLTLALVDVEAALMEMEMPENDRRTLQRIVRTTSFRERSWQTILRQFEMRAGRPPAISGAAFAATSSLKRADALQMITAMSGDLPGPASHSRPPLTTYYRALLAQK